MVFVEANAKTNAKSECEDEYEGEEGAEEEVPGRGATRGARDGGGGGRGVEEGFLCHVGRRTSRTNSLDAAVSLTVSVDGLTALSIAHVTGGEVGELVQTPISASSTNGNGHGHFGNRSAPGSFHTSRSASASTSGHAEEPEEA